MRCRPAACGCVSRLSAALRNLPKRYAAQVDEARAMIAQHFPRGTRATQPAGGRYRNALRLSCCYPFNVRYTQALAASVPKPAG